MLTRCIQGLGRGLAIAVLLAAVAGCPKKESAKTEAKKAATETAASGRATAEGEAGQPARSDAGIQAEVESVLAKADEFDGQADKVVSKCAGCALAMDGSPDYAVTAYGYTLHMCSAHCKETFEKDPTKAILAMKVPETPPAAEEEEVE
jgi:YHS domain-containing protein